MKALIHAPLFKFSICFLLGILCAAKWGIWVSLIGIPALLGFLLSFRFRGRRLSYRRESLVAIAIYLLAFAFGSLRQQISDPTLAADSLADVNCQEVYLAGYASSALKTNEWGSKIWIDVFAVRSDSIWQQRRARVLVYLKPEMGPEIAKHDSVIVLGKLTNVWSQFEGYQTYLHKHGIYYAVYAQSTTVGQARPSLEMYSEWCQSMLSDRLANLISDSQLAGIAQAMFLGDKTGLDPEVREAFSAAGLSHILAISGLHIGIIFLVLNWICAPLHLLRSGLRIKHGLVLMLLVVYMLLTGAGPAVVRAVLMFGAVLVFRIGYQRYHLLNLLAIAAVGQLLYDPNMLWQVGFQLSYSAVVGIVLLLPRFEKWVNCERRWLNQLFSGIGVTLIATLATTPFVWTYFGQFPTYFLLSNLLVSALSFAVVFCGFLTVLFCWIPGVNVMMGYISELLLKLMYGLADWIAHLPHAVITELHWNSPALGIVLIQLSIAIGLMMIPKFVAKTRPRLVLSV